MSQGLKEALAGRIKNHAETGLYQIGFRGPSLYTDKKIDTLKLCRHRFTLSNMAADQLQYMTTSGLVGQIDDGNVRWAQELDRRLRERGVELPIAEIDDRGNHVWGTPFEFFPHSAVTVLVSVNTVGQQIIRMRDVLDRNGFRVRNALVLVDRNPDPAIDIDKIPIFPVLEVPLPLFTTPKEIRGFVSKLKRKGDRVYESMETLWG